MLPSFPAAQGLLRLTRRKNLLQSCFEGVKRISAFFHKSLFFALSVAVLDTANKTADS